MNGGLVCVMAATNTERCAVRCNPGHQHILRPNLYEECGPSTNFIWTTDTTGSPILGCMGEYTVSCTSPQVSCTLSVLSS